MKHTKKQTDNRAKKAVFWGIGLSTAGVLSYLGFLYVRNKRRQAGVNPPIDFNTAPTSNDFTPKPSASIGDGFPLKRGSRGSRVVTLQNALIRKYGSGILPKYGADGIFGSEVESALSKSGLPTQVNESTYQSLVASSAPNAKSTADGLRNAVLQRNHTSAMSLLKTINSQDDYRNVSNEFVKHYIGGVRKTLVNGLLDAGFSEDQKQQIRLQFTRMGLSYDGSKWSLSGLDGLPLVSLSETVIWKDKHTPIQMPKGVILGRETARKGDKVWFRQGQHEFLVSAKAVDYLTV